MNGLPCGVGSTTRILQFRVVYQCVFGARYISCSKRCVAWRKQLVQLAWPCRGCVSRDLITCGVAGSHVRQGGHKRWPSQACSGSRTCRVLGDTCWQEAQGVMHCRSRASSALSCMASRGCCKHGSGGAVRLDDRALSAALHALPHADLLAIRKEVVQGHCQAL